VVNNGISVKCSATLHFVCCFMWTVLQPWDRTNSRRCPTLTSRILTMERYF